MNGTIPHDSVGHGKLVSNVAAQYVLAVSVSCVSTCFEPMMLTFPLGLQEANPNTSGNTAK